MERVQEGLVSIPSSSDDSDGEVAGPVEVASTRDAPRGWLSLRTVSALNKCLVSNPGRILFSLATESSHERRKSVLLWLRDQKNHGRLAQVSEDDEVLCLRWIEDNRVSLLKVVFSELESLRSYKVSADANIICAVDRINAAMSLRCSRS